MIAKKHILLITCLTFLISLTAHGQQPLSQQREIMQALEQGDSQHLNDWMNDAVQIHTDSDNKICSRTQAKKIMEQFFKESQPLKYESKQSYTENGRQKMSGRLRTRSGNFDIYIMTQKKEKDPTYLIHQIRIENGKE